MAPSYPSPGVYREERFVTPAAPLPTGVPGFVGFGSSGDGGVVALQRAEELAGRFKVPVGVDGYLAAAVVGFFENGGGRCYVAGAPAGGDREQALISAIERLGPIEDLDLVAIPDAMCLPDEAAQRRVQAALASHCGRQGDRFAILDAPAGKDPHGRDIAAVFAFWCKGLALAQPENAALYYPWVLVPAGAAGRAVPPCGHIAGIYARSDRRAGVFKAPANEELLGVLDLEYPLGSETQDRLNPVGINCLRAFPGRGLRVWGARTLSGDPSWRYINVRRLLVTLVRWIDRNMAWAAFEPNTPRLWVRIQRELNLYLAGLRESGALKGESPEEAFYVKCDAETNPLEGREQGRAITEIGLAPAAPAEFVVVRVAHGSSGARLGA